MAGPSTGDSNSRRAISRYFGNGGIHVSAVDTRYRGADATARPQSSSWAGLPAQLRAVACVVPRRCGLLRLPGVAALARRLRVPSLWDNRRLADGRRAVLVRAMPASCVGDRRNHLPRDADAPHDLVRGSLVRDVCQERRLGQDPAPSPRFRLLPDRVDHAASLPDGDGTTGSRSACGRGRGR